MNKDEDNLFDDAEDDAKAIAFIRKYLPQDLQDKFSDEELYYFIDVIAEYYSQDGILDGPGGNEDYIDVDLEDVAKYVVKKAKEENFGDYNVDEIYFVAEGEFEYVENNY